ncbi:MAG: ABC transporter substrate-binding protein [Thermodesulfovibrionales bacterium]|nr:ABC transporter substrate-binding protein [Thermodesulfovibrionales bacterium]
MFKSIILILIYLIYLNAPSEASYKTITDTEGRTVVIPQRIERAVVLTATCIETIYIIGAIDRVIGISKNILDNRLLPTIIPQLKQIPVVAQSTAIVNLESILALKPDVLITMGPEHIAIGMDSKTVKRIEGYGIPVILLNLKSLDENYYSIRLLGEIFDSKDKAQGLIDYMKGIVAHVQDKIKEIPPDKRVKALYVSGNNPNYVAGGYWKEQDIRVLAGGINVAKDIPQFMATVSSEQLVMWNPDVITISTSAKYNPKDVYKNPHLKNINAVKNKRVFKHPYHIAGLFTPRVPLLLAWHAAKFYPELGIDWVTITDDFFKKFYGVSYSGPRQ